MTPEQRMAMIADKFEICQIVCGYGYAADGCNHDAVGAFFAETGVYAVRGLAPFEGRAAVAGIADAAGHRALVAGGCAHVSTMPYVVVEGDRAIATCHTMLIKHGEQGPLIARVSASRLELSRHPEDGWQIDRRENELLDGHPAGPALFARLNEGPAS